MRVFVCFLFLISFFNFAETKLLDKQSSAKKTVRNSLVKSKLLDKSFSAKKTAKKTVRKPEIEPTKNSLKSEYAGNRDLKSTNNNKDKVINTPPISVYPIHQQSDGGQEKHLIDFKPVSSDWLEHYPSIKKEVENIVQTQKQEIQKSAEELFKNKPHSKFLPYRLYIEELKLFQPRNKDIASVRLKIYTYTGGAHGGTSYYSLNWSKKTKKFLSIDEILSPEQFKQVVQKTRTLLFEKERQGNKYDKFRKRDIHLGTDEKKDFKIWNLHQGMIIFVFPEYQVASYAAGSFEVHITF